ncbi:hypothetical protein HMPREF9065_02148 [Aggregatibacter sp. oral taxon 458 str. W10330]|nr:hypothetical protein HMPREF9065_02148 [Aggregatibacter sp. oral taxon 458 str. W10330]
MVQFNGALDKPNVQNPLDFVTALQMKNLRFIRKSLISPFHHFL